MDKQSRKVLFSSKNMCWETPKALYEKLNKEFNFDLDPCASADNAKCSNFFTEEDDGLAQEWGPNRTVFVNPPYGREIKNWVKKAYEESRKEKTTVVMLIPSRTDTVYWHQYCMKAAEIYFIKGRLKFSDSSMSAPFPSAVVVFRNHWNRENPLMGAL
jgi:site-specific DNA-methyltransferase (adenine-specific)